MADVGERSVGGREYVLAFGPADPEARRAPPEPGSSESRDYWGQISVHQCPICAALVVEDFMPDHEAWHRTLDTLERRMDSHAKGVPWA